MKKIAATILMIPLALVTGLFWGIAADKIAKGKEPEFTLLMLGGLAISVVVIASLSGASIPMAEWAFVVPAILYVGLRCLFGKGSRLEMFSVPHLLAILILLLLPAFERARQRARELRKPNQLVERTGMSRSAHCQFQRQRRLIPVAHLGRSAYPSA